MKKSISFFFAFLLCLCGQLYAQGPQETKFKPEKDMVNLGDYANKTVELNVGQRCYFQYTISVEDANNTGAVVYADDPDILSMSIGEGHWYRSPMKDKHRVNTHTTVFEAKNPGTTQMIYEEEELTSGDKMEVIITIVVK